MNLLIVSVDALPRLGGISLMAHHLANALVTQHGHQVVMLGPSGSAVPREYLHRYRLLEDVDSRVEERAGRAGLVQDARIRALVEATVGRNGIDRVLLLHPFYYGVGTLEACRQRGIPCSVYLHGFELRSQMVRRGWEQAVAAREALKPDTLQRRLLHTIMTADEVLVNSRYTASLLEGLAPPERVRITGCGIPAHELERELQLSPSHDPVQRAARRERFGLGPGPCVGFVGRHVAAKRVERLLGMCAACPELSALIVGSGPRESSARGHARAWGLEGRVRLLGEVSDSAKWAALRAVDFLCLLSESNERTGQVEGFGIALLEGAAAGAVPVSSGTGGMGDVVEHRVNGIIVPPWDADAGQLLAGLAGDVPAMKELVAAARAQLTERFTWEAVAGGILEGWS